MHRWGLGLVLALFLAGCGGLPGPPDASPDMPPGVSQAGVEEPETLHQAHVETLHRYPYTVNDTFRRSAIDGSDELQIRRQVRFDADPTQYWMRSNWTVAGDEDQEVKERTIHRWSNGTVVAARYTDNEGTRLLGATNPVGLFAREPSPVDYRQGLYLILVRGEFELAAPTGDEAVLLSGSIPDPSRSVIAPFVPRRARANPATVGNVTARLIVTEQGRIIWWQVSWTAVRAGGEPYRATRTVHIEKFGTTQVPRQAWVEAALRNKSAPTEVPGPIAGGAG